MNYYNEFDPYAAQWLRNLIAKGLLPDGWVDESSIIDVDPNTLLPFTQCHFFAGIGGWSLAARLAGWPDDRPLWTGSCPCQPYSLAGKGLGQKDERDLWPVWHKLIDAVRPSVVMGEQVKDAIGKDWLDRVHFDMDRSGYAVGATVLPACAVDAPHRRDRLWLVADTHQLDKSQGRQQRGGQFGRVSSNSESGVVDNAEYAGLEGYAGDGHDGRQSGRVGTVEAGHVAKTGGALSEPDGERSFSGLDGATAGHGHSVAASNWANARFVVGADGKARRVEPGIRLLAHGVPGRMGKLRAYGNAIVPQVAAEVIGAYMEVSP